MIGDAALYTKMELAGQAIKRDIVFAASLVSYFFFWLPICRLEIIKQII